MDSKELRIGNQTNFGTVRGLYPAHQDGEPQVIFDAFMCNESKVNPIPLTEQWLVDFGFTKNLTGFRKYIPNQGWTWEIDISNNSLGIIVNDEYELSTPIGYVHQLQNLWHSLTGNELEIK